MKLDPRYKVETIAANSDRPTLQHVLFTNWQDKPVAVATDGYVLAVVPVEMNDDDVPGLVDYEILRAARKATSVNGYISFALCDEIVKFDSGWTAPRTNGLENLKFPDWERLTEKVFDNPIGRISLVIQPKLLHRVAKVLGSKMVCVSHTGNENMVLVTLREPKGKLEPPFALHMLAHIAQ